MPNARVLVGVGRFGAGVTELCDDIADDWQEAARLGKDVRCHCVDVTHLRARATSPA
jgi:hypothetical protein